MYFACFIEIFKKISDFLAIEMVRFPEVFNYWNHFLLLAFLITVYTCENSFDNYKKEKEKKDSF